MDLLAAKSCGGAEGDGKTAVVLEPRRGRSDYGREEGACSKADQHAVRELELSGSTAPGRRNSTYWRPRSREN